MGSIVSTELDLIQLTDEMRRLREAIIASTEVAERQTQGDVGEIDRQNTGIQNGLLADINQSLSSIQNDVAEMRDLLNELVEK